MFCNNTHSCDVVINEDNTFGSLLNEFLHKHKGIEHLSIEKDTQFLFECTVIKSVEYLIDFLVGSLSSTASSRWKMPALFTINLRMAWNASLMRMDISTAIFERNTAESCVTPCSVKAYGE